MEVLRLETENGWGIYSSCMWAEILGDEGNKSSELHPMPFEDGELVRDISRFIGNNKDLFPNHKQDDTLYWFDFEMNVIDHHHLGRFGFKNRDQYLRWVYDPLWRQKLDIQGIKICVYEVPEEKVLIGDTQVVFLLEHATLIDMISPTTFDLN